MPAWLTSLFSMLVNAPSAFAAWFGFAKQRDAEANSPTMQANAQAKNDQVEADKIKADIAAAHAGKPEALEKDEA